MGQACDSQVFAGFVKRGVLKSDSIVDSVVTTLAHWMT